jgi:hypothetical protein
MANTPNQLETSITSPQQTPPATHRLLQSPRVRLTATLAGVAAVIALSQVGSAQNNPNPVYIDPTGDQMHINIQSSSHSPTSAGQMRGSVLAAVAYSATGYTHEECLPLDLNGNQISPILSPDNFPGETRPQNLRCEHYIQNPGGQGEFFIVKQSMQTGPEQTSIVFRNGTEQRVNTSLVRDQIVDVVTKDNEVYVIGNGVTMNLYRVNKLTLELEKVKSYGDPMTDANVGYSAVQVKGGWAVVAVEFLKPSQGGEVVGGSIYYEKGADTGKISIPQTDIDSLHFPMSLTTDGDNIVYLHGEAQDGISQVLVQGNLLTGEYRKIATLPQGSESGLSKIVYVGRDSKGNALLNRVFVDPKNRLVTDQIAIDAAGQMTYTNRIVAPTSPATHPLNLGGYLSDPVTDIENPQNSVIYAFTGQVQNPNYRYGAVIFKPRQPEAAKPSPTATQTATVTPTAVPSGIKVHIPFVQK